MGDETLRYPLYIDPSIAHVVFDDARRIEGDWNAYIARILEVYPMPHPVDTASQESPAAPLHPDEATEEEVSGDTYEVLTQQQLHDELQNRGLPVSGTKDEQMTRLEEDDRNAAK